MKWSQRARVSRSPLLSKSVETSSPPSPWFWPGLAGLPPIFCGMIAERLLALELDRAGVAADHLAELDVVAHRRRDDDLAALVVVGDDRRDVGHVAAVIFEVEAAGADDPPGEPDAHRPGSGG